MLCNLCNERDAVLLVQQVTFGGKKEVHLCNQCAKSRGIDIAEGAANASLEHALHSLTLNKNSCYVCGKLFSEIQVTGRAGCPECYISFNKEIKAFLEKKGYDLPYTGTMPKKLEYFRSILTDRIEIQKKMDNSIAQEDYEKAAMYRDFLKTLERSSVAGADIEGDLFDK